MVKVEQNLMGLPGTKLSDIKTVYSHPQALMQCSVYLDRHPEWKQISLSNTAVAAAKVQEDQDKSQAAIASPAAAAFHGLEVLEMPINHNRFNSTRFIIVTNRKMYEADAKKVSICFELPHKSGSLYNILSHMIYNDLNMCKIESRPIPERNWESCNGQTPVSVVECMKSLRIECDPSVMEYVEDEKVSLAGMKVTFDHGYGRSSFAYEDL